MAKIHIGMLVEIVGVPLDSELAYLRGHIGAVKKQCPEPDFWVIDGAERHLDGIPIGVHYTHLRPIDEPPENPDIVETKEKGAPGWDTSPWSPSANPSQADKISEKETKEKVK